MKVLLLSRSTAFDGTSSLANVPRTVLHQVLGGFPDVVVNWVVPESADRREVADFVHAGLPQTAADRLLVTPAAGRGTERVTGYLSTDAVWSALNQERARWPYDVVLCQQPALAPMYRTLLTNWQQGGRWAVRTPFVGWHLWSATASQAKATREYFMGDPDVAAELLGAVFCEANVWESGFLLADAEKSLRQWLQASAVRKVLDSSTVINPGVRTGQLEAVRAIRMNRRAAGSSARLVWGGRMGTHQKNAERSFEVMANAVTRCSLGGLTVGVRASSQSALPDWTTKYERMPDWRLTGNVNQDGWLEVLAGGDVAVCNSLSEGYGTAWLEMLAVGIPVVFESKWWCRGLLPDWYPFLAKDLAEQTAMTVELLRQWPVGPMWTHMPDIQRWVAEEHADLDSGPALYRELTRVHQDALRADRKAASSGIRELLLHAAGKVHARTGGPIDTAEVVTETASEARGGGWKPDGNRMTAMLVRRVLQQAGWIDIGSQEVRMCPPGSA